MTANELFCEIFANVQLAITFRDEWKNGTGYFDGAVDGDESPKLMRGELAKFVDDYGRNAVVVGLGTIDGMQTNIVVFQRFTSEDTMIVFNTVSSISKAFDLNGKLTTQQVESILGDPRWPNVSKNLGQTLCGLKSMLAA